MLTFWGKIIFWSAIDLPALGRCRGVSHTPIFLFRKDDRRATMGFPALGDCRGVSNTPIFLFKKDDRRATICLPELRSCRGVSHTPLRRPDRGERLSSGWVPVGRMRYAPTSGEIPALGDRSCIASPGCRSAVGVAQPWAIVRRPFRPHRVHICKPFSFGDKADRWATTVVPTA